MSIISPNKKIITSDNTTLHYFSRKSAAGYPTLVMLHGWAMNSSCFLPLVQKLHQKKYGLIIPDIRGHGKSHTPKVSIKLAASDTLALIKKEKPEYVILVGFSLGGMIALTFLLANPEKASGLILINSTYKNPTKTYPWLNLKLFRYSANNIGSEMKKGRDNNYFRNTTAELIFDNFTSGQITKRIKPLQKRPKYSKITSNSKLAFRKLLGRKDVEIYYEGLKRTDFIVIKKYFGEKLKFDVEKDLEKIKIPTLIISSTKDAYCHVNVAKKMHRIISSSDMKVLKKSDHLTILQEPEKISQAINQFIKSKTQSP
jgi:pimeloyl-ACP methyl ester carboxylesterase